MPWYEVLVKSQDDGGTTHLRKRQLEAASEEEAESLARRYVESDNETVLSAQSMGEIAEPGTPEPLGWGEGTLA